MKNSTLDKRLTSLEERSGADSPFDPEETWLARISGPESARRYVREPDYPEAEQTLREAIERAQAGDIDPPLDPPATFLPGRSLDERRYTWRDGRHRTYYPDVDAAMDWVLAFHGRVEAGRPPVTVAEFEGLAAWFAENEGRIDARDGLRVGDRHFSRAGMRHGMSRYGPRSTRAEEVLEELRALRLALAVEPVSYDG